MIIKDSKICSGVPIIKGTRIPITLVLANICDEICFDDICQDYHITKEDIRDSIDYAIKVIQ